MVETLGIAISRRRKELDISQRELATSVGLSNSTISRIEGDDSITPDTKTLRLISEVLKVDYNYLLALSHQIADEPEIRMIQRAARSMTQAEKEKMMSILKKSFEDAFNTAGGDEEDID